MNPIPFELVALGVAFYDILRSRGATDFHARHSAVNFMREMSEDNMADVLPLYVAIADALATRATARHIETTAKVIQTPERMQ